MLVSWKRWWWPWRRAETAANRRRVSNLAAEADQAERSLRQEVKQLEIRIDRLDAAFAGYDRSLIDLAHDIDDQVGR